MLTNTYNPVNQKIAISILKRLGYHDVIIAGNGREALDLMRVHKFDVIFVMYYHNNFIFLY